MTDGGAAPAGRQLGGVGVAPGHLLKPADESMTNYTVWPGGECRCITARYKSAGRPVVRLFLPFTEVLPVLVCVSGACTMVKKYKLAAILL